MTAFYKLSGAGNDFVALIEPDRDPIPSEVQSWCRRGLSLGADGVFVLRRSCGGGAADLDMVHWNADGSFAELCLNGTRCAIQLATYLGWAEGRCRIATGSGSVVGWSLGSSRAALELPAVEVAEGIVALVVADREVEGCLVEVGVPHFVVPWPDDLATAPVAELGPPLRSHPRFERGANVDFVGYGDCHSLAIRTWERGVEAETLACGTGVLAAVAAGLELGRCRLPVTASTRGGFELEVSEVSDGVWSLAGDARLVARGELLDGAS